MSSTGGFRPAQIEAWLEALDSDLAAIQSQLEPLLVEQTRLQERRILLKELVASFDDHQQSVTGVARPSLGETTRERVHRQAVDVFKQVARPLHVNDLQAEFLRRGYEIPGAGKPNNITVHLTGWSDIACPERGIYGLVEHVGEAPARPSPKRRKRKTS